jgi:hypothetical protein
MTRRPGTPNLSRTTASSCFNLCACHPARYGHTWRGVQASNAVELAAGPPLTRAVRAGHTVDHEHEWRSGVKPMGSRRPR